MFSGLDPFGGTPLGDRIKPPPLCRLLNALFTDVFNFFAATKSRPRIACAVYPKSLSSSF